MRRSEFGGASAADVDAFLDEMHFGVLAFADRVGPDATPMNFVYERGAHQALTIHFHASMAGHRRRCLEADARVAFSVAREFAVIPSTFLDPHMACFASAFFKSVVVYGRITETADSVEKARILSLLMARLQPEGGYTPIRVHSHAGSTEGHGERSHGVQEYTKELKRVSVLSLRAERVSAKFKFGQNLSKERREAVVRGLERRNGPGDRETLREMQKRFSSG